VVATSTRSKPHRELVTRMGPSVRRRASTDHAIEAEAPDNPRIQEAMRHMSAPSSDPEIERRYNLAP